ncbi:MAG: ABC transporter permease [Flavitalea sp.]
MNISSHQRNTWQKLLRNKSAGVGMIIIVLALLTAVFAYMISPDHTPDANRMTIEIGGRNPGFTQLFLKIEKEVVNADVNFFHRLLYGQKDAFDYLPVSSYTTTKDTLYVQKYVDEGISEPLLFPLKGRQVKTGEASATGSPRLEIEKIRYVLGTDKYGRDILSRLVIGVRVSLGVGLVAVILSLSIGILLGSLAGYYRGRVDDAIMWFINVIWSIPTLLLVFAVTLLLGKGFWQVFIAIGLTTWVNVARLIRGQVLSIREMEYVEAARALGFNDARIIIRHILPNVLGPVIVIAASNFAAAIVIEAGLSFLGVGVQPPQPSWGLMIKENYNFIITHNPMLALAPGFAIMILVLAFNIVGNGLRDALQVKV